MRRNAHMDTCVPHMHTCTVCSRCQLLFWHVCSCLRAAGGQRGAVHQRQLVGGVCEDSHRAYPEESLPASPQLHRGEAEAGGWEWETGEAWICTHKHTHNIYIYIYKYIKHTHRWMKNSKTTTHPHIFASPWARMLVKSSQSLEKFFFLKVSGANVF